MKKNLIFVDTWAWYAMSNRKDKDHQKAKELNIKFVLEGYRYVTTNFIFAESYTLIIMRGKNHHAAIKFGENLKQMIRLGGIDYFRITEQIEKDAWEIAKQYDDKDFSYIDCTSFALMKNLGISIAFTNDDHFKQMGFQIVE